MKKKNQFHGFFPHFFWIIVKEIFFVKLICFVSFYLGNEPSRNFKHLISVRNTSVQSNSEVKRVRLNQDRLWKQCQISFGLFNLFNLLSLIVYIGKLYSLKNCPWISYRFHGKIIFYLFIFLSFPALVETHLFSEHHKVNLVILHATNRLILYLVPITLLIINAGNIWYRFHVIFINLCIQNFVRLQNELSNWFSKKKIQSCNFTKKKFREI